MEFWHHHQSGRQKVHRLERLVLQAQQRDREVEGQMQQVAELMNQLSLAQDLLQQALNGVEPGTPVPSPSSRP